ncbi:hypothetical protein JDV02_010705 [Purpureocillium takamizusanense]|uniref:Uncharacterized protein n=1 Tax=Purpureocillium takamizusanense TaxID=2060973 RepID=A0A9Q8VHJ0_9HYPO|nr:uncharacterized protein JDV02_010705 [Purpureocillium takamizusanense]UNI24994.1 hypothetical protein JDV02_010705 [Purpureocillium takamizusanense]
MGLLPSFKQKYVPLLNSSLLGNSQQPKSPLKRWILIVLFAWWNVILVGWGLYCFKAYINSKNPAIVPVSCDCGATIEEAVSKGCKYDALSVSWLPPQCRDDELTFEFNKAGPGGEWLYWADRNMTQPLTLNKIGALADKPIQDAQFWTTFGWHISHCSFYWRKEHRMRDRGVEVEHRYDRESHIKHCHTAFMARTPLNETNTKAAVGLGGDKVGGVRTEEQTKHEHVHNGHEGEHHD